MTGKILNCFILLFLFAAFASLPVGAAEPPLTVQGIMPGENPIAIVNGNVVKPGDVVEGARVSRITDNAVIFILPDGRETAAAISAPPEKKTEPVKPPQSPRPAAVSPSLPGSEELFLRLSRSQALAREAEGREKKNVLSVTELQKIAGLYEKSQREAQYVIENSSDPRLIEQVKSVLPAIREQRQIVIKKKNTLEDSIRAALAGNKLILGMTKNDVTRSWGKPRGINTGKPGEDITEQWVYDRDRSRRVLLLFADDILVAAKTAK